MIMSIGDTNTSVASAASTDKYSSTDSIFTFDSTTSTKTKDNSIAKKKKKREWKATIDKKTGKTYYYNKKTRESRWDKPPGFTDADDKKLQEKEDKQHNKDKKDKSKLFWKVVTFNANASRNTTEQRLDTIENANTADANTSVVVDDEDVVRDIKDSTLLFRYIRERHWGEAVKHIKEQPQEARVWISSGICGSPRNGGSTWKVLPLHAALVLGAPLQLVIELLDQYPNSARRKDLNGSLPIHLAASSKWTTVASPSPSRQFIPIYSCEDAVFKHLLKVYPESRNIKDRKGRTPIQLLRRAQEEKDKRAKLRLQKIEEFLARDDEHESAEEGIEAQIEIQDKDILEARRKEVLQEKEKVKDTQNDNVDDTMKSLLREHVAVSEEIACASKVTWQMIEDMWKEEEDNGEYDSVNTVDVARSYSKDQEVSQLLEDLSIIDHEGRKQELTESIPYSLKVLWEDTNARGLLHCIVRLETELDVESISDEQSRINNMGTLELLWEDQQARESLQGVMSKMYQRGMIPPHMDMKDDSTLPSFSNRISPFPHQSNESSSVALLKDYVLQRQYRTLSDIYESLSKSYSYSDSVRLSNEVVEKNNTPDRLESDDCVDSPSNKKGPMKEADEEQIRKNGPFLSLDSTNATTKDDSVKQSAKLWKATLDKQTGKTYYYNRKTRVTRWDKPDGFDEAERGRQQKKAKSRSTFPRMNLIKYSKSDDDFIRRTEASNDCIQRAKSFPLASSQDAPPIDWHLKKIQTSNVEEKEIHEDEDGANDMHSTYLSRTKAENEYLYDSIMKAKTFPLHSSHRTPFGDRRNVDIATSGKVDDVHKYVKRCDELQGEEYANKENDVTNHDTSCTSTLEADEEVALIMQSFSGLSSHEAQERWQKISTGGHMHTTGNPMLFIHLHQQDWPSALIRISEHPQEASVWIEKKAREYLLWKLLPLHAAIILCAPSYLVLEILNAYPIGARKRDMNGSLPVHLAASRIDSNPDGERIVNHLIRAFPDSIYIEDGKGITVVGHLKMQDRDISDRFSFEPEDDFMLGEKKSESLDESPPKELVGGNECTENHETYKVQSGYTLSDSDSNPLNVDVNLSKFKSGYINIEFESKASGERIECSK